VLSHIKKFCKIAFRKRRNTLKATRATVNLSGPIQNYCEHLHNTVCNRIRYTNLKIYCDQMSSNITTQFLTEHLLTIQDFLQVFSMAATGYAADIHTIF
jgi:dimeric dUTPase (all-alpha-NTP-PPase superfamily)